MEDETKKQDELHYGYSTESSQVEEENRLLRHTISHLKGELDKFMQPPLLVAEIREVMGDNYLIKLPNGNTFYVDKSDSCEEVNAGDYVLCEQKNLTIIKKVAVNKRFNVEQFVIINKPTTTFKDIGGLDDKINELKEVIELPLKKPELFKRVGIQPPKAVLLYGPPGTGKTLMAKAVAQSTDSTFIEIVGSELVQKFIGEGAKLVKEIFQLAREKSPSIIFIDELDAIAATRIEVGTSGEREVQRTFMQLLAEIDGFKPLGDVKVIGCTNRKDVLDPAILRPGRLDRQIKVPVPDPSGRRKILEIHSQRMNLSKDVDLDEIAGKTEEFSGAELKAVCTEAGYCAIRTDREHVVMQDFLDAIERVQQREDQEGDDYLGMFG